VLPFPIPASIYGMALLMLALLLKLVKVEAVDEASTFLVSLLSLLLVVPNVGLMSCWDLIKENLLQIVFLILSTTVLTFGVSGLITKLFHKRGKKDA
jgi:holin-like protein